MEASVPGLSDTLSAFYGALPQGAVEQMKGDASTRRYYRFRAARPRELAAGQPASLIVMRLPDDPDTSQPATAQALSFLDVQRWLSSRGLPVPAVHHSDLGRGLLLLEDLGDETFEARLRQTTRSAWPERYAQAIDLLAHLHVACKPPHQPSDCIAYARHFDAALLRSELHHFREWGLAALYGALAPELGVALDAHFDALTASIDALPKGFVHRDYQSRNLMWAPGDRLTLIDFQDAFLGPAPYDLVALLCDSYVELDAELQLAMLDRYATLRGFATGEREALQRGFHLIAVQRKLKDAGRFVFIDRVRKNPDFLPHYPQSLRYVGRALAALPELRPLQELLLRSVPGFPNDAAIPRSIG